MFKNENVTEKMIVEAVKLYAQERCKWQGSYGTIEVRLTHPIIIQGVPSSGSTRFTPEGRLHRTTLTEDYKTEGTVFPAGTDVCLYDSGKMISVSKDERLIQGILCEKGRGRISTWNDSRTLARCTLASNTTIQGITCAGGREIALYKSGRLQRAFIDEDHNLYGVTCAGGHEITLYESGKLKRAFVKNHHNSEGIPCADGEWRFLESGALQDGVNIRYSNAKILHASGKLEEALAEVNLALERFPSDVDGLIERFCRDDLFGFWFPLIVTFMPSSTLSTRKVTLSLTLARRPAGNVHSTPAFLHASR